MSKVILLHSEQCLKCRKVALRHFQRLHISGHLASLPTFASRALESISCLTRL